MVDLPAWEGVGLRSVGVDIGSATSHMVFSEITMAKVGQRFVPVGRRVTHRSPIRLTPYVHGSAIDIDDLLAFIDEQFAVAGVARDDIDCGAVILTGTALERDNARLAADLFAAQSGRFVTVSAGDGLEAVLAAHGSGSVEESDLVDGPLLNIDVGGGTTKFALCVAGRVVATAAIDVGTRLIVVDERGVVTRLDDAARRIGQRIGVPLRLGAPVGDSELAAIATYMVDQIWAVVRGTDPETLRTAPLPPGGRIVGVMVSGGVSGYLDGHVGDGFGDLGPILGQQLSHRLRQHGTIDVRPCASGIRATVLGAALFTVQLSGDTIHVSSPGVLPLRDVPVVAPACTPEEEEVDIAAAVRAAVRRAGLADIAGALAVAVRWDGIATLHRLTTMARGLATGLGGLSRWSGPLVLVCDDDIGRLLGRQVHRALTGVDVISLDGVDVRDLDFVDVGTRIAGSGIVPVTVKSLVFSALR